MLVSIIKSNKQVDILSSPKAVNVTGASKSPKKVM